MYETFGSTPSNEVVTLSMYFSTDTIDRGCLSFFLHITKPAVQRTPHDRLSSFSSHLIDRFSLSLANDLEIFGRAGFIWHESTESVFFFSL